MFEFSHIRDVPGWFQEPGPEYDVVIASRVRLSRNISGFLFPGMMSKGEEDNVQKQVERAFSFIPSGGTFQKILLSEITPTARKILLERNIISQEYSLNPGRMIFTDSFQKKAVLINEIDHVRLFGISGGMEINKTFKEINGIDTELEEYLEYAVSIDLGYLNTEIANIGTGLRASVMLHLPALVKTSHIEKAFKAVMQIGLNVKGFFGDDDHSLGNMYQISNQVTLGLNEKEIIEKLENIARQIVHYERKAREDLMEKRRIDVEDEVYRAYGILKHCKSLSAKEAIELLSALRMGISLGLLTLPLERITAAVFVTQKAHIQQVIRSQETGADTKLIDYTRSKLIQDCLEKSAAT